MALQEARARLRREHVQLAYHVSWPWLTLHPSRLITKPVSSSSVETMQGPSAHSSALKMADHNGVLAAKEVFSPSSREVIEGDQLSDKIDYHDQYHSHLRGSKSIDNGFTKNDRVDMRRMGKQQELRRDFRALSALAFTVILQGR